MNMRGPVTVWKVKRGKISIDPPEFEPQIFGRPASSVVLYRLRYAGLKSALIHIK